MAIESVNPATGQVWKRYPSTTWPTVDQALAAIHEAFLHWRHRSVAERARPMRQAADVLRQRQDHFARLITDEMGKPLREARSEIEKCAWGCEYFAEHAERLLAAEEVVTGASHSMVVYRPLGVVLAVMPWNFPFWQVFRFAAPALMAGNTVVLKHASNVPSCASAIEELLREAGFPADVFRTLLVGSDMVPRIIQDERISAVTLTGSTPAGRQVAREAAECLKKTVLELGGSDPYVVLEDADLESAVADCVTSRLQNTGQSCIAAKRFIVVHEVADAFERAVVERMRAHKLGDPAAEETDLGPMARVDLRDALHDQVQRSIAAGARCELGGKVPEGAGAYYPATVLTHVSKGMPAFDEELFGPVAAIVRAHDEDEALALANDSRFGLGAAVFTRDVERGLRIAADRLDAGSCFVNTWVKSDPRLPFGGVKESGYGRELGRHGIHEFCNIKTVWAK